MLACLIRSSLVITFSFMYFMNNHTLITTAFHFYVSFEMLKPFASLMPDTYGLFKSSYVVYGITMPHILTYLSCDY